MTAKYRILALVILGLIVTVSTVSCAGTGISPEEYDQVKASLVETQQELANIKQDLAANTGQAQTNLDQLNALKSENENLKSQISGLNDNIDSKDDELATLSQRNKELETLYKEATKAPGPIDTANVEQLIFDLVNEARVENGVAEVALLDSLYKSALENTKEMVSNKKEVYYGGYWQGIFRATGYTTAEQVADAAMKIWESDPGSFSSNFLQVSAHYGAVSAQEDGGIIYITVLLSS